MFYHVTSHFFPLWLCLIRYLLHTYPAKWIRNPIFYPFGFTWHGMLSWILDNDLHKSVIVFLCDSLPDYTLDFSTSTPVTSTLVYQLGRGLHHLVQAFHGSTTWLVLGKMCYNAMPMFVLPFLHTHRSNLYNYVWPYPGFPHFALHDSIAMFFFRTLSPTA